MKTWISILFVIIIVACQPEPLVVDDVPQADSKMVVSTVIGGERLFSLFLTRSYGALSGDIEENPELINDYIVPNAEVWVKNEFESVLLDELVPGVYGTNNVDLVANRTYQLEISDPQSNQSVTSSTDLKQAVFFDEVNVSMETSSVDTVIRVNYKFDDAPGESYYMVNVQKATQRLTTPESVISNRVFTHLVSDQASGDGNSVEGEFLALFRFTSFGDTLLVSLSNISFEYYDYLERINNGFLGPSLITEPYNYPSNVEGGYGFFNMYYNDNRFLILDN